VPSEKVIDVKNSDDIVAARQAGHQLARDLGFSLTDVTMIATAISEIARNITTYAGEGEVTLRVVERPGSHGVEVVASDAGPGIEDVERAMQDGYTTGNGLGLGLPGTRRLVDDFHLDTTPGVGTTIRLVKWTRA